MIFVHRLLTTYFSFFFLNWNRTIYFNANEYIFKFAISVVKY